MDITTKVSSIFFCLFDNTKGPVIVYQDPPDYITSDAFYSIIDFVIPKQAFCNQLSKITSNGKIYVGHPTMIKNPKYGRNALLFNLVFVFSRDTSDSTISRYEHLIEQINDELRLLETNEEYLINVSKRDGLASIIPQMRQSLNSYGFCHIDFCDSIELFGRLTLEPTMKIDDITMEDVPVKIMELSAIDDLGMLQIMPYINGKRTAYDISKVARADEEIVSEILKQLVYGGYVVMIPKITDEKRFICTKQIVDLIEDDTMVSACINYCKRTILIKSTKVDIVQAIISIQPTHTWGQIKTIYKELDVDMYKLLKFLLVNKVVRETTSTERMVEVMSTKTSITGQE
ncbi:Tumor suppressor candidate, putative [Entamoeba invadens IP1]|uniref:Tumor suppressor candidate, putative n=1 Tax=Entamoeba invadens IP1 TaxID=370355 RepID=UPI0002C3FB60|nr:Tumor suppressor candidate, putative [Entamoeba invadens IP1]ELP94026.1 Tumor suppressor candidate, putative [Entamoeba invadens IP1]|eukprot:XP_004260797.1 Tumor suppressor candidate, putative [Entamoeba invadens IP1]